MHSRITLATGQFYGTETVVVPPNTLGNPTTDPEPHLLNDWAVADWVDIAAGNVPAIARVVSGDPTANMAGLVVRDPCVPAAVKLLKSIDAKLTPAAAPKRNGGTLLHRT